jgi:RNA polymerase sigma-70 factor (ECF subfamily)
VKKEEQFNTIVAENKERIRRICSYYNANKHDQQDMFQEILINIWKSLERFRGESAMTTWIYRIAVNTAISYVGKLNRYQNISLHTDPQNLSSLFDDDVSEERQFKEEQLERLQQELNMLSIIDKTIMSLVLEELSTKEIADVIGITEPNVRVKIHRIKSQLKTQLKGGSHGNE